MTKKLAQLAAMRAAARAAERISIAGDMLIQVPTLVHSQEIDVRVQALMSDIATLDFVVRKPI